VKDVALPAREPAAQLGGEGVAGVVVDSDTVRHSPAPCTKNLRFAGTADWIKCADASRPLSVSHGTLLAEEEHQDLLSSYNNRCRLAAWEMVRCATTAISPIP
jgi:hypothetical protein